MDPSFVSPIVIGCIQLGATVDYAILMTTRFREELQNGHERVEAINLTGEAVNRSWNWGDNMTINNGSYTRTDGTTAAFGDVALNYDVSPRRAARPFLVHERVPHRAGGVPFVDRAAMQLGEAMAGFVNSRQLGDLRFDEAVIAQQELFLPVPRIM